MSARAIRPTFISWFLIAVIMCLVFSTPAYAETTNDLMSLSKSEVSQRFQDLYDKYDPGDIITGEDAAFIGMYAQSPSEQPKKRAEDKSKAFQQVVDKYGTKVRFNGLFYHRGTFEYTYGGDLQANVQSGPAPKSMTMSVNCQSYGIVSGGYVVTHEGSVTHTASGVKSASMNKAKKYSGLVVLYYLSATLDVTTASGNGFNVIVS